jgi:hypothetical protein
MVRPCLKKTKNQNQNKNKTKQKKTWTLQTPQNQTTTNTPYKTVAYLFIIIIKKLYNCLCYTFVPSAMQQVCLYQHCHKCMKNALYNDGFNTTR